MNVAPHPGQAMDGAYPLRLNKTTACSPRSKAALKVAEVLNARTKYIHRVEVVRPIELPKFSILKPAKNEAQQLVIPASFKVIKKRSFLRRLLGAFF